MHAGREGWSSRQAKKGFNPNPLPLRQHSKAIDGHDKLHVRLQPRTAKMGGDEKRFLPPDTGVAADRPAWSSTPIGPFGLVPPQKHELEHPNSDACSIVQAGCMQHHSMAPSLCLQQLSGPQLACRELDDQKEKSVGQLQRGREFPSRALQLFSRGPSASEASSCEPQPWPLPPRLSGSQLPQTAAAQLVLPAVPAAATQATAHQRRDRWSQSHNRGDRSLSDPLMESRQALPHNVPLAAQPVPCSEQAAVKECPEASKESSTEAAGQSFVPGCSPDDIDYELHAAQPPASSLGDAACAGPKSRVMPGTQQSTEHIPLEHRLMSKHIVPDMQKQQQATGSVRPQGLHQRGQMASHGATCPPTMHPSQVHEGAIPDAPARKRAAAGPRQAIVAPHRPSRDTDYPWSDAAAMVNISHVEKADRESPLVQQDEEGQPTQCHTPEKVDSSCPQSSGLDDCSRLVSKPQTLASERLLYICGSDASDLLLGPCQLGGYAQPMPDQLHGARCMQSTAAAAHSEEYFPIADRHCTLGIHPSSARPRGQLAVQDHRLQASGIAHMASSGRGRSCHDEHQLHTSAAQETS